VSKLNSLKLLIKEIEDDTVVRRFKELEKKIDKDKKLNDDYKKLLELQKIMINQREKRSEGLTLAENNYENAKEKVLKHIVLTLKDAVGMGLAGSHCFGVAFIPGFSQDAYCLAEILLVKTMNPAAETPVLPPKTRAACFGCLPVTAGCHPPPQKMILGESPELFYGIFRDGAEGARGQSAIAKWELIISVSSAI